MKRIITAILSPATLFAETYNIDTSHSHVGLALRRKPDRKNFTLSWNKALEKGGVIVADTIKLDSQIEGILLK